MPNDFTSVDIWVGLFPTSDALNAYIAERPEHYADETDTLPISQLAQDMHNWFIDHDFECIMFVEEPSPDISYLLQESLIHDNFGDINSSQFGEAFIAAQYTQQKGEAVNSMILVYGDEVNAPRSVQGQDYWLHYIGRYFEPQT